VAQPVSSSISIGLPGVLFSEKPRIQEATSSIVDGHEPSKKEQPLDPVINFLIKDIYGLISYKRTLAEKPIDLLLSYKDVDLISLNNLIGSSITLRSIQQELLSIIRQTTTLEKTKTIAPFFQKRVSVVESLIETNRSRTQPPTSFPKLSPFDFQIWKIDFIVRDLSSYISKFLTLSKLDRTTSYQVSPILNVLQKVNKTINFRKIDSVPYPIMFNLLLKYDSLRLKACLIEEQPTVSILTHKRKLQDRESSPVSKKEIEPPPKRQSQDLCEQTASPVLDSTTSPIVNSPTFTQPKIPNQADQIVYMPRDFSLGSFQLSQKAPPGDPFLSSLYM
jgi:hypothetical protein